MHDTQLPHRRLGQRPAGRWPVLRKHDGETRAIASNGSYSFDNLHLSGSQYEVTVQTPPTDPSQTCTIANNRSTVGNGDVRNVNVTCATDTFSVGGSVTGLLGSGLVLQNNGRNNLNVTGDGAFTFTEELASNSDYNVQVAQHPSNPTQMCSVVGDTGRGRVTSDGCHQRSDQLQHLQLHGRWCDHRPGGHRPRASEQWWRRSAHRHGQHLHVPDRRAERRAVQRHGCRPADRSGAAMRRDQQLGHRYDANVSSVQINCVTTEFSIGGTVIGLNGSGLQLQLNGGAAFGIAANGPYTFPTSLPNGTPYTVTIAQNPVGPTQICALSNSVGIVSGANVTNVEVSCVDAPL